MRPIYTSPFPIAALNKLNTQASDLARNTTFQIKFATHKTTTTMFKSSMETVIVLAMVVLVATWMGASAQSTSGCTTAIVSLSPCLGFITGNASNPSSSCCTQLGNVVQSEPQCLCAVLNGGASNMGFAINQTQALLLPSACSVQTPPASRCNNGGAPAESPAQDSPAIDSPPRPSSPSEPSIPSGTGSKTTPTTDANTSAAVIAGSSWSPFLLLVLAAFSVLAINPF